VRSRNDGRVGSRRNRGSSGLVLAAALSIVSFAHLPAPAAAQPSPTAAAGHPNDAEVAQALAKVRADPNLATERTIRTLRWKDAGQPKKRDDSPEWLRWIRDLFRWVDQSTRLLVWGTVAFLGVLLAVYLVRLVGRLEGRTTEEAAPFVAPTHVRDLDIRPEALPSDIGAAARVLWDQGEHRGALSLLYRGLLSRLAHVHRVPLRDSSTEGDCLALASRHLTRQKREYAARLVGVWQRAVYGREDVQTASVHGLCDEFAAALDTVSPHAAIARQGPA
jgi:hypothetical protein